jgi:hypothetical protein
VDDAYFGDPLEEGLVAGFVAGLDQLKIKVPDYMPPGVFELRLGTSDPYQSPYPATFQFRVSNTVMVAVN